MPETPSDTPSDRPDATAALTAALRSRILVLDGAMGTMIQRHAFSDEADYRGERFADWPQRPQGQQRPARRSPSPRSSRAIHRAYLEAGADLIETNTFNAQRDLAGRLRHAGPRLRAEPRLGPAGPRRLRRGDRTPTPAAALRRRRARARRTAPASISPDVNDPGARNVTYDELVEAYLEQARRPVDGGADVLLDRDDLRHAQRQGRDLRGRDAVRAARPALAGHDLRHHHRRLRTHPVRPGHRGVLELRPARPAAAGRAQLRARRGRDAALPRRAVAGRRLLRLLLPERRPAQRLRRVRRDARRRPRRSCASSPRAAWSTSSAAAAAPRPRTSPRSPPRSTASPRACRRAAPAGAAAVRPRAADDHRRTRCSSTSASAPTSPARPASAT